MALPAIFPRVDATLAQLRELGEAVQIINGRKGAVSREHWQRAAKHVVHFTTTVK